MVKKHASPHRKESLIKPKDNWKGGGGGSGRDLAEKILFEVFQVSRQQQLFLAIRDGKKSSHYFASECPPPPLLDC